MVDTRKGRTFVKKRKGGTDYQEKKGGHWLRMER